MTEGARPDDQAWRENRTIGRAIALAGLTPASHGLRRRVLDAALPPRRAAWWRPAAAFAAAAALGLVVGWSYGPPPFAADDQWAEADSEVLLLGPDYATDEGGVG